MKKRLGKLELQVMKLIWDNGKATVRDVWEKLYPEKGLAYTTIATVMRKLEEKRFVKHDEKDRTYIYYPITDRDKVSQGILRELIEGFFDGSVAKLITTLIQNEHLTEKDINQIQQIILKPKTECGFPQEGGFGEQSEHKGEESNG
jgi:predicted transcriptional regulator